MFTEDSSDLSVGLIATAVAGLLLIPIIVLYSSLMNSGLELNADMNHVGLLFGSICLALSIILIAVVTTEAILDHEGLYYFLAIVGIISWMVGTFASGSCLFFTGEEVSFIHNYEFINLQELWFVLLSCVLFAVAGFFSLIIFFKKFDWCHNGMTNIYLLGLLVILFVLITIFMLNGLLEMVFGVVMISAIPFVINVISIVVSFIKNRC